MHRVNIYHVSFSDFGGQAVDYGAHGQCYRSKSKRGRAAREERQGHIGKNTGTRALWKGRGKNTGARAQRLGHTG